MTRRVETSLPVSSILAPEDQSDQVDQEGMADQELFRVVRLPATAGDHGLFESFGLDLDDLADLFLEPFPIVDGGSGDAGSSWRRAWAGRP